MTFFKRWNNIVGWAVFAIAAFVYLKTMEPVSSLWDCSEFIATSYKLEVGHPPGAPLFMMLARLATLFALGNPDYVGIAVNAMNSLASAFCILFLFWTITHLARRLVTRDGRELTVASTWAVLGAGIVGALAYTFTDTFWFSAIEGEVYALSSMFTALVIWLMLKWEDEADQPHSLRWIVLIAYMMGLSIGVHILNLLTIPALVFIYYFRTTKRVTWRGMGLATLVALLILGFINGIIIPYTVYCGAMVDLFFVNTLGLPVNSGMVLFALALIIAMGWASWYTHRKGKVTWNVILLSTTMILIGYSSYASMTIRAAVNPPMNSNNPNNPFALYSVLNRDQYGDRPLFYGPYYSAPIEGYKEKQVRYLDEDGRYKATTTVTGYTHSSEFMHLFPRMWEPRRGERAYKPWAAYRTKTEVMRDDKGEIVRDEQGRPVRGEVLDFGRKRVYDDGYDLRTVVEPTFAENLYFFFNYQLNYMYWRYFLWNFVGRQSDIQPSGSSTITDGNWLSGIRWLDERRLGPQDNLPHEIAENKGRNTYYFLPFLLGLVGLLYQLNRDPRNFSIVMWLFIMTGVALVFYFNTAPGEPRERDYVYAGSFYAFSIWIGFGVLALRDLFARLAKRDTRVVAGAATLVGLVVPAILAAQNWDDHDRSHRTMARDIGWNYLMSTLPNSIILNYGDNDTFPLWLNQEVDGLRPDVRIMNTSYLGGEWYIDEMKTRANEAAGVPFTLPRSKYWYRNDYVPVYERVNRPVEAREAIEFFASDDQRTKVQLSDGSSSDYLPSKTLMLPVDKQNVLRSGIVAEKDKDLIVDTVYIKLSGDYLNKGELMIVDMLSNYDWTRPIYLTQPYIFQKFGLVDYLQFDGYAYRFVPILTPYRQAGEVGRIDPEYAVPLLLDVFRYGNLDDEKVYSDYFTQYNLSAARAREAFARVAKELIRRGDEKPNFPDSLGITEATNRELAIRLLDEGMRRMPPAQVRYTSNNTLPFIEAYYAAGAADKGDALMLDYARNLMEYVDYYFQFDGWQYDSITDALDEKLDLLGNLYSMAGYLKRDAVLTELNAYYRSLGVTEEELIQPDSAYLDYEVSDTAAVN